MIAPPILEPHRYTVFPAERDILQMLLFQTAYLDLRYTAIVEIGAHEGKTTEFLAARRDGRPYYVIDPWDGTQDSAGDECYARFVARVGRALHASRYSTTGLETPPITVIRKRSQDVTPPERLGFVFHDGDHRDLSDVSTWWDALVPGGILCLHDTYDPGWPNVRPAITALGPPWHEYRYQPTPDEAQEYGPSLRGLLWKVKPT